MFGGTPAHKRCTEMSIEGLEMRKIVFVVISLVAALSVAGCVTAGKSPAGKGKAPIVHTKG